MKLQLVLDSMDSSVSGDNHRSKLVSRIELTRTEPELQSRLYTDTRLGWHQDGTHDSCPASEDLQWPLHFLVRKVSSMSQP